MLVRWPTALQGALEAEESLFNYKSFQTPHFSHKKKKKKNFRLFFQADYLSLPNTFDSPFFFTIIKVVLLHQIFLSLVLQLGFDVQGCGCSFLATIHTLLFLQVFLSFILLNKMLYYFSKLYYCFLACHYNFSSMFPCLRHDLWL